MKEIDFDFKKFNLNEHEKLSSNMNFVARIKKIGVIKITPPGGALARFPDIKLYEDRILRDLVFNDYCKICPAVLAFDLGKRYFIMEDLGPNDLRSLLRNANEEAALKLINRLDSFFKDLEVFYKKQTNLPEVFSEENPLIKDHYAHIFEYPLFNHEFVCDIWSNINLDQSGIDLLSEDYKKIKSLNIQKMDLTLFESETLIHGDLHTGSVIFKGGKFYLIDGEFSHLASVDFDLGMLYANLLIDLTLSNNNSDLLDDIKQKLSKVALKVALFELVRQLVGVSFSVPTLNKKSRKQLIESVEELNFSLS